MAGPPAAPEPLAASPSSAGGLARDGGREVEEVLLHFSVKEARARRNYRRFVEGGVEQPACHCEARAGRGRRPDLQENRVSKGECKEDSDSRILGDRAFIERVLNDTDKVYRPKKKRIPLPDLVKRVSETLKVDQGDLSSGDRKSQVSKARSVISYVAVREMGYSGVEVGRILNLSGPGVTKSVEKGKRIISADESLRRKLIS